MFSEYCDKIHEQGFTIIPVKGKAPLVNGWNRYCKEEVDETTLLAWSKNYPKANIGLPLGKANNIVAVDIDTEDEDLLLRSEQLLPRTPLAKKGKKGGTYFYRYSGQISKGYKLAGAHFIDFLSDGRQTVLPPSLHPDGMKYEWTSYYNIVDYSKDEILEELPIITNKDMELLISILTKEGRSMEKGAGKTGGMGRNNYLKSVVCSMLDKDMSIDQIVAEILIVDKQKHKENSLFRDPSDFGRMAKTPAIAAQFFAMGIAKSILPQMAEKGKVYKGEGGGKVELSEDASDDTRYPTKKDGFFFITTNGKVKKSPDIVGLSEYLMGEHHLSTSDEQHFIHNGTHYDVISELGLKHLISVLTGQPIPSTIEQFKSSSVTAAYHRIDMKASTDGFINMKNGVLRISDRTLQPHSPKFAFRYTLPHAWEKDAKCPEFIRFLDFIYEQDQSLVDLTQEMIGYLCLGGEPWLHKAFILNGSGRNGKSTLLDAITHLLGKQNISAVSMSKLDRPFSVVRIDGKLANIVDEAPGSTINAEIFKTAVGGGYITAAHKNKPEYDMKFNARMLFATNQIPKFMDSTPGTFEKLCIIPFNKYIPEDARDRTVIDKIKAEASGIMSWALDGAERLMARGNLPKNDATAMFLEEYRQNSDSVYDWFCDKIEIDPEMSPVDKIKTLTLYDSYKTDMSQRTKNIVSYKSFTQRFSMIMKHRLEENKMRFNDFAYRTNSERGYTGVRYSGVVSWGVR